MWMGGCACPGVFASAHLLVDAVSPIDNDTNSCSVAFSLEVKLVFVFVLVFVCVCAIAFAFAHMLCDALYNL